MLTYNSVAEIFEAIDRTREGLRGTLDGLGPGQEQLRDSPDRWSIAEIIEHLAIIEESVGKLAGILVQKAEGDGAAAKGSFPTVDMRGAAEKASLEKYEAPDMARPRGGASVADSLARLTRSRAALHALRPRIEALDLTSYRYPHPAFGPLDLYHWLAFVGMHEERHRRQIEGLKTSAAPGSAAAS